MSAASGRPAPLALSMGEPAGIGPDLILQLYARRAALGLKPFIVYGHSGFLKARAKRLGLDIAVGVATPEDAAEIFPHQLPVHDIAGDCPDQPGQPDTATADIVAGAIERAVAHVRAGRCAALVTAPIHKGVLYQSGFNFPGHTEYLAALSAENGHARRAVMMLAHEDLRVVPLTIHVPLRAVPEMVTKELITRTVDIVAGELAHRFAISQPKLAMCGLNPHAGEDGAIGREEIDVIIPALEQLRAKGFDIAGPLPADTLFYPPHWRQYDCVIATYHDQGLVPIKTVAFDKGVNITLGLDFVRTSPDHGTAFGLAGTGKGSPKSLLAALHVARQMSENHSSVEASAPGGAGL